MSTISWSGRTNGWDLLETAKSRFMFSVSGSHEEFQPPQICWKYSTAGHKQSRRLLGSTRDNFLIQMIEQPTRSALLVLILTNEEGIIWDVKLEGSRVCSAIRWWSSGSWEEGAGQNAIPQHWTSEDQILSFSRIYSVDSNGIRFSREERAKKPA